ncbi:MAG: ABC transporter ATP-binding protein [Sarcina sp.]
MDTEDHLEKRQDENIIIISNLRKSYDKGEVLKGINLEITRGEVIGYIGSNGAGKSTTVKLMLGLVDEYSGDINIFGKNIKDGIEYKRRIGYVPEVADLYDALTPREYFRFLGGLYGVAEADIDKRGLAMMDIFGVKDVYDSRIASFSKGMRQKTVIVSSLIHNPDILFFDEPLTGLDANSVMIFKDIIVSLAKKGKTIFYSSHIMEVVEKISNRIILLDQGEVRADGTIEELKNMSQEGSLESIFSKLTGFTNHEERSNDFLSVLED